MSDKTEPDMKDEQDKVTSNWINVAAIQDDRYNPNAVGQ